MTIEKRLHVIVLVMDEVTINNNLILCTVLLDIFKTKRFEDWRQKQEVEIDGNFLFNVRRERIFVILVIFMTSIVCLFVQTDRLSVEIFQPWCTQRTERLCDSQVKHKVCKNCLEKGHYWWHRVVRHCQRILVEGIIVYYFSY